MNPNNMPGYYEGEDEAEPMAAEAPQEEDDFYDRNPMVARPTYDKDGKPMLKRREVKISDFGMDDLMNEAFKRLQEEHKNLESEMEYHKREFVFKTQQKLQVELQLAAMRAFFASPEEAKKAMLQAAEDEKNKVESPARAHRKVDME